MTATNSQSSKSSETQHKQSSCTYGVPGTRVSTILLITQMGCVVMTSLVGYFCFHCMNGHVVTETALVSHLSQDLKDIISRGIAPTKFATAAVGSAPHLFVSDWAWSRFPALFFLFFSEQKKHLSLPLMRGKVRDSEIFRVPNHTLSLHYFIIKTARDERNQTTGGPRGATCARIEPVD